MKINSISYKDIIRKWNLEETDFNKLTLLVGASGVGKTQILKTIMRLKRISQGNAIEGAEWELNFNTDEDSNYIWKGKSILQNHNEIDGTHIAIIDYEELSLNDERVFERNGNIVNINGKEAPKIDSNKSVLSIFREEEKILPAVKSFEKIYMLDYVREFWNPIYEEDVEEILNGSLNRKNRMFSFSDMTLLPKLLFAYNKDKEVFLKIKGLFTEVFPFVEDIKIGEISGNMHGILIKEKNSEWIPYNMISSGMAKTLMHIVAINLAYSGSVILIDEFENSLGINCIDAVADDMLMDEKNIQFIITSHHPYIVNNISMNNWKVVVRDSGNVSTRTAQELNLGKSKHEAFDQLINSKEFKTGVL